MNDNALVDAVGTHHSRVTGPARIVSLVPSITELVCDLGLADQLVGRTGFCVHPRAAVRSVRKLGGTKDVHLSAMRELEPTHVILNIDENTSETADALRQFVPHLIVTHPASPEDNFALYRLIGGIFAREHQAEALCARLRAALDSLPAADSRPGRPVLYLIWRDPWMTVSPDTYIARMLALVNWQTIPSSSELRYPEIDLATLPERPELVLLSSEPYPFRERHVAEIEAKLGATPVELIAGDQVSWYGSRAIAGVAYLDKFARRVEKLIGKRDQP